MDLLQFSALVLGRFSEMALAPQNNPEIGWIALPVLGTLFLMQVYFSRHHEPMDWNNSFGNGATLIFVAFDLMRRTYSDFPSPDFSLFFAAQYLPKTGTVLVLLAYAFLIMGIAFFRTLPDKIAFTVASYTGTSVVAYAAITIIYADLPVDLATLLAFAFLMAAALLFTHGMKILVGKVLARIFPTREEREDHEIRTRKYDRKKFTWLEKGEV